MHQSDDYVVTNLAISIFYYSYDGSKKCTMGRSLIFVAERRSVSSQHCLLTYLRR